MAVVVSATFTVGARLQQGCRATGVALAVDGVGLAMLVTGAAGAGWWASQGVRLGHGFLAGLVTGMVAVAALIAVPLVGLVPQLACGAPPQAYLRPQVTSIQVQSAVSFVVELALVAGTYGLLAAGIRRRAAARRRDRSGPDAIT